MSTNKKATVLLIDDDAAIRETLELRLTHAGYSVVTAADSASACVRVRSSKPDIAVIDINMPGGDGFSLSDTLDRLTNTPLPKIYITASKRPEYKLEAGTKRASRLLEKPFSADLLLDELSEALSGKGEFDYIIS